MKFIVPGLNAFGAPLVRIALALLSPLLTLSVSAASTITLAWDPSPDSDVVGYILYWGPSSGKYSSSTNVSNRTTTDFAQLTPGVTCYFVVTAVNAHGLESDPSNEISYLDPLPNTPPTISDIADQFIAAGTLAGPIGFTIGDAETAVQDLTLTASSSNPFLVPLANIVFGGSAASRSVVVTPTAGASGSATITVTVSDGGGEAASDTFILSVAAPNALPSISSISDISVLVGNATADIPFSVGDLETPASALTIEAGSSDHILVPTGNIALGGSGANRTVRVTTVSGRTGTATVTISVFDTDNAMASASFRVNVTNAPPPAGGLAARWACDESSGDVVVDEVAGNDGVCTNGVTRQQGVSGGALLFDGLNDVVTVPNSSSFTFGSGLTLCAWFKASQRLDIASGRRDLIGKSLAFRVMLNSPTADGRLTFALNSGTPLVKSSTTVWERDRWYHVVATHDGATMRLYIDGVLEGTAPATVPPNSTTFPLEIGGNSDQGYSFPGAMDEIRIYDMALSTTDVSGLYVSYGNANNNPPQISTIADLDLAPGSSLHVVEFVVGDNESPPDRITLTGRSSNPLLLPASNVVFGGGGSNRTVIITPLAGQTGQSVITVIASDGELTTERLFTVTVAENPNVLTVNVSGEGTVTPDLGGKRLVLGRTYLLTARPAAGYLFAGWSGATDLPRAAIRIVMQANMKLTARFVPNPFIRAAGVFNGLFHEADEVHHDTSGHLRVVLAPRGAYSARMRIGGRSHSWTGRFALDGQTTNVVRRPITLGNLTVVLQLDSDSGIIAGSVSHDAWQATVTADRAAFYTAANPSPYRARYTMLLPAVGDGVTDPAGTGFGRGLVNYRGLVTMDAVMPDGRVILIGTTVSQNGLWPFFANLYGGRGSVLGWVNFVDRPSDDFHGLLSWTRPSVPAAIFYPAGFTNDVQLVGSRFLPPASDTDRILDFSDGRISLTGGNLTESIINDLTLEPRVTIIDRSDNALHLGLGLLGGWFAGSVRDPASGTLISFRGALIQKANYGAGFFRGTDQIGRVYLGP